MPTSITIPTRKPEPFYEQARKSLPIKVESVLTANNIRVGAGTDIFAVSGAGFITRSSLTSSSAATVNGDQVVNQIKVTSLAKKNLIAIIERAVYVSSKVVANLLPGGSGIDESQFQVIGNNFSIIDTTGTDAETHQLVNHFYVRNISAGAVTIYFDAYVRYIINT
jgi:hypothetical protein